jgi:uncharacterized protein YjiS (DUF1127 family)
MSSYSLFPTSKFYGLLNRRAAPSRILAVPCLWLMRSRTRRQLRDLDERLLVDIGRLEVERRVECAKWFWQG